MKVPKEMIMIMTMICAKHGKMIIDDVAGSESGSEAAGGARAVLPLCVRPQEPDQEKADRDRRAQTL